MPLLAALVWMIAAIAPATADEPSPVAVPSVAKLKEGLAAARENDARRNLPVAYGSLESRIGEAEDRGASAEELAELQVQVQRLRGQARFLAELRKHRSAPEALLNHYDRTLRAIAALEGITVDPVLSGDTAAEALLDRLATQILQRQVSLDSLRLANRYLEQTVGTRAAQQESTITALRLEVTALRQQLWDMQLRAGVAEADRSVAEHRLASDRERSEAVRAIAAALAEDEGDVVMTPEGAVVMRLHGFAFRVGGAALPASQSGLLDKVVAAVRRFPNSPVRIEGHTDDTGSRAANLQLSRRRAEMVAQLLAERLEVPVTSFEIAGVGPDKPVASNATAEGRARNRRIDVIIGPER